MQRNTAIWFIPVIVFVCTLCLVSVSEAHLGFVHTPHQFSMGSPHVSKVPYPVFAMKFGKGFLNLSEAQKAQIREHYWEFLIRTAEIWYKLQSNHQDVLPEMRTTPKQILTSEQAEKLQKRKNTGRMLFRLKAGLQDLMLAQNTTNLKTSPQIQTVITEGSVILDQERPVKVAQENVGLFSKQYLQQLQILRL